MGEGEVGTEVRGTEVGGDRHGGAGASEGDVKGGEVGRDGAGASGGDHGGLGLLEEPLDGLSFGLVAELARKLEDAGGAECRHANAVPAAVHLGVAVLGGGSLRWRLLGGGGGWFWCWRDG